MRCIRALAFCVATALIPQMAFGEASSVDELAHYQYAWDRHCHGHCTPVALWPSQPERYGRRQSEAREDQEFVERQLSKLGKQQENVGSKWHGEHGPAGQGWPPKLHQTNRDQDQEMRDFT